jgi:DNA-binding MarR family transcriptional regulator
MTIQEEIKQSAFKSEYQKLIINQLFTGRWLGDIIAKHLKPFGLSNQQYNVLRILRGQPNSGISVNAISERMIDKMSNVSRLIDKLKLKGLIKRTTNKADRRQVDIEITKAGLKVLALIDEQEEQLSSNFKTLSLKEAKQLNDLLDKLRG